MYIYKENHLRAYDMNLSTHLLKPKPSKCYVLIPHGGAACLICNPTLDLLFHVHDLDILVSTAFGVITSSLWNIC
jgi:hypothetical protein